MSFYSNIPQEESSIGMMAARLREQIRTETIENMLLEKRRKLLHQISIRKPAPKPAIISENKDNEYEKCWSRLSNDCEYAAGCALGMNMSTLDPTSMRMKLGSKAKPWQNPSEASTQINDIITRMSRCETKDTLEGFSGLQAILVDTTKGSDYVPKSSKQQIQNMIREHFLVSTHNEEVILGAIGVLLCLQRSKIDDAQCVVAALNIMVSSLTKDTNVWLQIGVARVIRIYLTRVGGDIVDGDANFQLGIAHTIKRLNQLISNSDCQKNLENSRNEMDAEDVRIGPKMKTLAHEEIAATAAVWVLGLAPQERTCQNLVHMAAELADDIILPFFIETFMFSSELKDQQLLHGSCPWRRNVYERKQNGEISRLLVVQATQHAVDNLHLAGLISQDQIPKILLFLFQTLQTSQGLEPLLLSMLNNLSISQKVQLLPMVMRQQFIFSTLELVRRLMSNPDNHYRLLTDRLQVILDSLKGAASPALKEFASYHLHQVMEISVSTIRYTLDLELYHAVSGLPLVAVKLIKSVLAVNGDRRCRLLLDTYREFFRHLAGHCTLFSSKPSMVLEVVLLINQVVSLDKELSQDPWLLELLESDGSLDKISDLVADPGYDAECRQAWHFFMSTFMVPCAQFGDRDFADN